MAKCYCADCAYSSYDSNSGKYYCGITHLLHDGSDSASCSRYSEK